MKRWPKEKHRAGEIKTTKTRLSGNTISSENRICQRAQD
jgi:hypothetical protein